jgi:hypothetical protein
MPTTRITVTAVSAEGDTVIVWGRADSAPNGTEPVGFAFQAKGDDATVALAEEASRLAAGTEAIIEYTVVAEGWNLGRGLAASEAHLR